MGSEGGSVARGATIGDITSSSTSDTLSVVDLISDTGDLMKKPEVHKCGGNMYMKMENQDIQVGVGERRSQLDTSASVVVLALNVPSWILVLKSLGFSSISLYCEEEACWFRRALALEVQEDFSLEEMESAEWYGMDQRSFFIQGDAEFCSRVGSIISQLLKPADRVLWVSSYTSRHDNSILNNSFPSKYKFWESQVVRHSDVGGISSNKFRVGWSTQGDMYGPLNGFSLVKDSVLRTLRAVTKTMEPGIPCASPEDDPNLQGCLCLDRHMDSKFLTGVFRTPFQLSRTKWVKRRLTNEEMGAALDLPVGSIKAFSLAAQLNPTFLDQLRVMPPLKLIQSFGTQFFRVCRLVSVKAGHPIELWKPRYLEDPTEFEKLDAEHAKAAKSDGASVDTSLWDLKAAMIPKTLPIGWKMPSEWKVCSKSYDSKSHDSLFKGLRTLMLRRYRRNLYKSFRAYIASTYAPEEILLRSSLELRQDLEVGRDALVRGMDTSFWAWNRGSTIFFWRWNSGYKKELRDGFPVFVDWSKVPSSRQKQVLPSDPEVRRKEKEKLMDAINKGYLESGYVKNLTHFFSVEKGKDIRMVYDATLSGLNEACWAPNFGLPTIDSVFDCATDSSFYGDVDAAEMFLTYPLNCQIRPYAGVDLTKVLHNPEGVKQWFRWNRCGMGFTFSPYIAIRGHSVGMEHIVGNRRDVQNPFYWGSVILNYPGTPSYNPTMPRVYKWNEIVNAIAGDQKTYVDDTRPIGHDEDNCNALIHQIETGMSYYGLPEATKKRKSAMQRQGAWAGSRSISIKGVGLYAQAMKSKWIKVQGILRSYQELFNTSESLPSINLKSLAEDVGFLVHVSLTYPVMRLYLKGFFLSMNSWRPYRDDHGWKLSGRARAAFFKAAGKGGGDSAEDDEDVDAPEYVTAVPSFHRFLMALSHMFEGEEPALRLIRGTQIQYVGYGFGDASGSGFGSSWLDKMSQLVIRIGMWNREGVDTSSNYRELRNLVETLELMGIRGELEGFEIFLFTDNSVSESVAFKGNSTAELLFELVLRLWNLEMRYMCKVNIIHVAGTRMIEQGTDGLSRGDMLEGVCMGDSMASHIPLAETALERASPLLEWIESWFSGRKNHKVEILKEDGWFERGHDLTGGSENCDGRWTPVFEAGNFIWAPAPAGAKFAAEQLRQARHKRLDSLHVFVCPHLMVHEWISHVRKSADLILEIKAGSTEFWTKDKHESLVIGIYLPFATQKPWQLKRSPMLVELDSRLRKMWKEDSGAARDILQQLLEFARSMGSLPVRDVRNLLFRLEGAGFPLLYRRRTESTSVEAESGNREANLHDC